MDSSIADNAEHVFIEDVFKSPDDIYNIETPIHELALSPKYQKLIQRFSAVIDHVETV